jgi:hypothetical protein
MNGEQLLRAIQPICEFDGGELRLISVFGPTQRWRVQAP